MILTFDIETVRDTQMRPELETVLFRDIDERMANVSAPANYKDEEKIARYISEKRLEIEGEREERRKKFGLSPMTGQIACISVVESTDKGEEVDAFNFVGPNERDDVLAPFWKLILDLINARRSRPRWVSFNGKDFDAGFVMVRSAMQGLKTPCRIPSKRYDTQAHFDVREVLCNFDLRKPGRLDDWLAAFGYPVKIAHGNEVQKMFDEDRFADIAKYCLDDVRKTRMLFETLRPYFD